MRILLTGATGFIGQRLLEFLIARNSSVHTLCRKNPPPITDHPWVKVFPGDILDATSISSAIAGCDQIYHVAGYAKNWARHPQDYFDVNVQGTRNILEAALRYGVQKIVYTSSAMTIGPSNGQLLDESGPRKTPLLTHYEVSKIEAEDVVMRFVDRGLNAVIVNPTRVFGPGLLTEGNSVTKMVDYYLRGKWRVVPGNGDALGNYAYVEDVVLGHALAMEHGRSGERYLLGGENASYNTLFENLSEVSGKNYRLAHLPNSVAMAVSLIEEHRARWLGGYPSITPGWMRTFLLDSAYTCSKAIRELGYRITPLSEALHHTAQWLIRTQLQATISRGG